VAQRPLQDAPGAADRALRTAIAMGLAHALLFMVAYWLLTSVPGPRAPDEEIIAFFASDRRRRVVLTGLYLMPFAGIAFLWLCIALRAWLRRGPTGGLDVLAGIQLASGILYVGMFFAAAGAVAAVAVTMEFAHGQIDPMLARQLPQLGQTLMMFFAMRMAAMFVFTTSRLGRLSGLLPPWFAFAGIPVGLFLLLSASYDRRLVLVFPAWLIALCTALGLRARQAAGTSRAPRPVDQSSLRQS
jgi:hypothetical protein